MEFEDKQYQRCRLLAYVTGLVNQELLLKNQYLLAENCILKTHLQPGFRLFRPDRTTLAEIGKRLGRRLLQQVASMLAAKFDGSRQRRPPSRLPIDSEIERLASARGEWAPGGSSKSGFDAYATSKQSNIATMMVFSRETPRLHFNAVEPGFNPTTGLGGADVGPLCAFCRNTSFRCSYPSSRY